MKQRMVVLIVVAFGFFAVCYVPSGCASAERRVRIFDVNDGYVKEVRNAVPGFTREIAECSPDRLNNTFSTLQNARFCGDAKCRSTIRVYDTNATLRCTSFVPFPDGVYLSPRQFSVCSGKIIFWNSRFSAKGWVGTNELCVATLCDKNSITGVKRIAMPSGCSSVLDWEESFMWSTPTSIVVNVMFERQLTKRIAIVDAVSGDIRFLSFDVRAGGSLLSSFQCSFSRRFFAVVTRKGEVLVCDGQGNVRNSISMGHLQTLGLCEVTDLDLEDESLSICWDDGDVLWIFNANGRYVCKDIETNSVIKNGSFSLGMGEKLVGFIQGSRAVIKQKRSPEIIRSIWGNRFYVKDIDTGNHFAEMPNFVSRYTYLGEGLILLEDV